MTDLDAKKSSCADTLSNNVSSRSLLFSTDCYPFVNWLEDQPEAEQEKAVVFRSLVATLKLQPAFDVSLEAQAAKFLKSVHPTSRASANAFLSNFASSPDFSLTDFVQSIIVLVSSSSEIIVSTTMEMLDSQIQLCSENIRLALVKADLIPQLLITLNPLSLSFTEAVDIHSSLIEINTGTLWITTPIGLRSLGIKDRGEQQSVHETGLKQILTPSEHYIRHLCTNRFSIIDDKLSLNFLSLLARHLRICPYYQPAMDFVLNMPIFLTIPSCLTFIESDHSIESFLYLMYRAQREWNKTSGEVRQMWITVHRMLRMEGIEDVMEEKLQNDENETSGQWTVIYSIDLNNFLGMNVPERE
ncbi:hypothetical protein BLNAU_7123 [Blattamonas nauphoetae]|uniref:Uncharacterized protein n=1 Tax=Blattamonas nauphoetae TaxID=2049346 RepID=A0ABQ9Y2H9_9EUKA|nr:hypothetical protein BLNAU_7123 [Blattamonas nauphoetae]